MSEKKTIGMLCSENLIIIIVIAIAICLSQPADAAVKNVIIMIGDGMGFEQVKAASLYAYGDEGKLPFEKFYRGEVTTHSANSYMEDHYTDSAASGSAMATGQKFKNETISEISRQPVKTILEHLKEKGKSTGLVTTVPITHATPAAFGAHARKRDRYSDIANDYLTQSRPNILFGAYYKNGKGMTEAKALNAGYEVVKTSSDLMAAVWMSNRNSTEEVFIAGMFSPDGMPWEYDFYNAIKNPLSDEIKNETPTYHTIPHLSEMTSAALIILSNDPDGFFLMVEGGMIDWAGHDNIIEDNIFETLEFAKAFQVVYDWAKNRNDTLVIVTADHECGGLKVVRERRKGLMPEVIWTSTDHTGANVPIYTTGPGEKEFIGVIDNTQIFLITMGLVQK